MTFIVIQKTFKPVESGEKDGMMKLSKFPGGKSNINYHICTWY